VVKERNIIRIVSDYQKACQYDQWTCTQQLETELCSYISHIRISSVSGTAKLIHELLLL